MDDQEKGLGFWTQLTLSSFPVLVSPPPYSRMDENTVPFDGVCVAGPVEPGYITPNHQDGSVRISRVALLTLKVLLTDVLKTFKFLLTLAYAILKFLSTLAYAILVFLSPVTHEIHMVLLVVLAIVRDVLSIPREVLRILLCIIRFTGWALAIVFLVLVVMALANFGIMVKVLEKALHV